VNPALEGLMPEARRARSGDGSSCGGGLVFVFWGIQKSPISSTTHYSPANFNDSACILGMTVFAQGVLKPQQRGPKPGRRSLSHTARQTSRMQEDPSEVSAQASYNGVCFFFRSFPYFCFFSFSAASASRDVSVYCRRCQLILLGGMRAT